MRLLFTIACLLSASVAEAEVGEAAVASCLCDQVKSETEALYQQKVESCQREKEQLNVSAQARIAEARAEVQRSADASLQQLRKELDVSKQESLALKTEKTALEKKAAELASISDKAREVETYKSQVVSLTTNLQTCQADMSSKVQVCQKDAETRLSELKRAEQAVQELQKSLSATRETSEQLKQCQSESVKLSGQMDSMAREHLQKEMKLQSELTLMRNSLESLKEDHAKSTNVIYSQEQFNRQLQHGKIIGVAFVKFAHTRLINLIGRNNYDLIILQASVFGSAAKKQFFTFYQPVQHRVITIYRSHGEKLIQPLLVQGSHYYQIVKSYAQDRSRQILTFVDNYMNRLISNLSSVDPEVRSVFPESFNDRCFAFAFVSLILFVLSEVVQWTFNKCVAAPVCWMLGINVNAKSGKKAKTSSSKSKSSTTYKSGSTSATTSTAKEAAAAKKDKKQQRA